MAHREDKVQSEPVQIWMVADEAQIEQGCGRLLLAVGDVQREVHAFFQSVGLRGLCRAAYGSGQQCGGSQEQVGEMMAG